MLHAPDTATRMFTPARLLSPYTVALSGSLPKGAQVYAAGLEVGKKACMFTVCVSQHWWSDLLLAVMWAEGVRGVNVQSCRCSCTCRIQTYQLLLTLEQPSGPGSYVIQVSLSAWCGQHFGICYEYLWCQLVHKSYVTQPNSSLS